MARQEKLLPCFFFVGSPTTSHNIPNPLHSHKPHKTRFCDHKANGWYSNSLAALRSTLRFLLRIGVYSLPTYNLRVRRLDRLAPYSLVSLTAFLCFYLFSLCTIFKKSTAMPRGNKRVKACPRTPRRKQLLLLFMSTKRREKVKFKERNKLSTHREFKLQKKPL